MSTHQKGCKFCTRYGLPLLPLRPAVMAFDDTLPQLSVDISVPLPAQGETAYTARLLREGFLYIWHERSLRWINYYVTPQGFYYPLPEDGDVPAQVVAGDIKPCITQPEELACASLITLPVNPAPLKNGCFWFAWSEVQWTQAVRQRHEDAEYRAQYMQCFDMEAWLTYRAENQALPISALSQTVAEYSLEADRCAVQYWSPSYWKCAKVLEGQNIIQAAETLSAGLGAMLILQDPLAQAQEISALINYRLAQNFSNNAKYSRGLALSSALSGLQNAMCAQFERDILTQAEKMENRVRFGWETTGGILQLAQPARADALHELNDRVLALMVSKRWGEYEKYIDRQQESQFLTSYQQALTEYDLRIISPMTQMYLDCMKSQLFLAYLDHNFDPEDVISGGIFVQAILDCVTGMQDKKGAADYFCEQLSQPALSARNVLLRATVMNNLPWSQQITGALSGGHYDDLPWDKLLDGFKDITGSLNNNIKLVMENFLSVISNVLLAVARKSLDGVLMPAMVAIASCSGYALKTVTLSGERKYFIKAVLAELAQMTDIDDRASRDRLRHYIDIELRRMKISGVSVAGNQESRFIVMVNIDEANKLKSLPLKERAKAAVRAIHSVDEITDAVFPRYWHHKLSIAKGVSAQKLASDAAAAVPFAGCVLSMALQWNGLLAAGLPQNLITEKGSKFVANIISAIGASAEMLDALWRNFRAIRLRAIVRLRFGMRVEQFITSTLRRVIRGGAIAGIVAVVWDFYKIYSEGIGNLSIGIAYLISTVSGGVLWFFAMTWLTFNPWGIMVCLILVFGSAIYLATQEPDKIQKWLAATMWRKIPPGEKPLAEIMPTAEMEQEAFSRLVTQGGNEA